MKPISPKLAIFDTFKTKKELTGEALRQRSIIVTLATQSSPIDKTRTAISRKIANDNGTTWKNLYSGVFRDLDEILIPLGIIEEDGRLPLKRGPKALQEKGVPYYRLTKNGMLVSLSLNEIEDKRDLMKQFFLNVGMQDKEFLNIILKLANIAPKFTFSLFEKYVKAYCVGNLKNLLPFTFQNLKDISDESLKSQREFVEAFSNLSKHEKEETVDLFRKIC